MDKILGLITKEIHGFNKTLDTPINLDKGKESVLFGRDSNLQSIDFVSLIASIEQAVSDEYGKELSLVDARAMSQKNSPFRTVGSLAEYINEILKED
ncbi:MAG: acyl carrier protein [Selenomonadaceae bacterium]|nr:acyl carrier protein [Selenomonadaceae bacterium]